MEPLLCHLNKWRSGTGRGGAALSISYHPAFLLLASHCPTPSFKLTANHGNAHERRKPLLPVKLFFDIFHDRAGSGSFGKLQIKRDARVR
jgi:hypothetical protein